MNGIQMFSLEGKTALVTGAAYGIGFAIAEAFAAAGAKIAFNCRSEEHMAKALADYEAKGIDAKGYLCDVTDETQVQKMVADIEKELGVIDILVNNAGIIRRIPMTEMSAEGVPGSDRYRSERAVSCVQNGFAGDDRKRTWKNHQYLFNDERAGT